MCTRYHGPAVEAARRRISDGLSPEAVVEPGKQRQSGPGDITSCVFEKSVVCVIWFRWKRSVWIAVGSGFQGLSLHHSASPSAYLNSLCFIIAPPPPPWIQLLMHLNNWLDIQLLALWQVEAIIIQLSRIFTSALSELFWFLEKRRFWLQTIIIWYNVNKSLRILCVFKQSIRVITLYLANKPPVVQMIWKFLISRLQDDGCGEFGENGKKILITVIIRGANYHFPNVSVWIDSSFPPTERSRQRGVMMMPLVSGPVITSVCVCLSGCVCVCVCLSGCQFV